jgi:hypothetical protein
VLRWVRASGENLILFRDGAGRPGLVYPRCTHRGASLNYGRDEAESSAAVRTSLAHIPLINREIRQSRRDSSEATRVGWRDRCVSARSPPRRNPLHRCRNVGSMSETAATPMPALLQHDPAFVEAVNWR